MEFGSPQFGIGPTEPGTVLPDLVDPVPSGAGLGGPALAATRRRDGELLVERIVERMQRRVRGLTVSVHDDHTLVVARAESWHVRQLIEQAVLKEIPGEVRFDVQVGS